MTKMTMFYLVQGNGGCLSRAVGIDFGRMPNLDDSFGYYASISLWWIIIGVDFHMGETHFSNHCKRWVFGYKPMDLRP